jgi:hypothetical protein
MWKSLFVKRFASARRSAGGQSSSLLMHQLLSLSPCREYVSSSLSSNRSAPSSSASVTPNISFRDLGVSESLVKGLDSLSSFLLRLLSQFLVRYSDSHRCPKRIPSTVTEQRKSCDFSEYWLRSRRSSHCSLILDRENTVLLSACHTKYDRRGSRGV